MSTAEWPRPSEAPHAPRRRPARRRGTSKGAGEAAAAPAAGLAGFVALEARAIDAEKWPVCPVVWWQPELRLEPPQSSGLRNERRHRVPVAGFIELETNPVCPAGVVAMPDAALRPQLPEAVPMSDLTPLGWDPRSIVGKGVAE